MANTIREHEKFDRASIKRFRYNVARSTPWISNNYSVFRIHRTIRMQSSTISGNPRPVLLSRRDN